MMEYEETPLGEMTVLSGIGIKTDNGSFDDSNQVPML
jgi:hypothetical protein